MIEHTEFGILISEEEWEDLQEKLRTTNQENKSLKLVLRQMNSFLAGDFNG